MHAAAPLQSNLRWRFASLTLVTVLHLLLLLALLRMVAEPHRATGPREVFLQVAIPQRQRTAPLPASSAPSPARPSRGGLVSGARPSQAPALPAPNVRGFGQSLFGCAPENLPNLDIEQRRHCTGLTRPDDSAVVEPPSHVKDPLRRAAEMRTKNTPGHIPCAIVMDTHAPGGGGAAPGVNPLCVIDGLVNGFGPLNGLPK